MPKYVVDLWLDGYDSEDEMEAACDEFIYEQLNFTASSVRFSRFDISDDIAALRAELHRLRESLIEIDRRDTYSQKSYGQFAEIARSALGEKG